MSDIEVFKTVRFSMLENMHFLFKNKCDFNDLTVQEVLAFCVEKFINGEYDKELGLLDENKFK